MKSTHERFESGWIGISLALRPDEVDALIRLLQDLKAMSVGHFHLTQEKWMGESGVADIEVSLKGESEPDDMRVG